ncbi:Replication factor C subunit 3 [Nymphon striatum]|nr:Replication factor C subunit 3 [Nymphon striatum]
MVEIRLGNGWIDVGKWLDLGWKMVGLTLENGWIYVGKWLDLGWEMVGFRLEMVGFMLENGWKMVGIRLGNGWIYVGKWLELGWEMVGFTLENGWINVGKWLDLRWKMVGFTLGNGWIYVGKWLDLRWEVVQGGDFPHLLIHGPSGAGKKTRVMCLLRELYGSGVEKLRIEHQSFTTPSKKKLDIVTIASNYHIEVNPSDVGIYDRVVIQELLKTVAQTQQLDTTAQREFKVVVLTEVDRLTKDAQHALRRTMEKYMVTCRLILISNSTSKVIPAIRSRCLSVRVPAPSHAQIASILHIVCKKESLNLPQKLAENIAIKSNRNLRRAILMCEACKVQQYPFQEDQNVSEPDWLVFIRETSLMIVQEQSPNRLFKVRERIYELLTHCIPTDVIFKELLKELIKNCDGELKREITAAAAFYEHRLQHGSKAIYHIEAFIAKFMSIYKGFLEESMLDDF